MKIEQKVNIHNRFDVHVNGEWVGYAENIILDQMWDRLCAGNNYFVNIHFGTGSGVPTANRTSLFAHLGTKTAVTEETIKAVPLSSWKRKIVLNPEEFVGATITEVGIAFGSTASNLVTHAMLKDSEGNPISITKSDLDVVVIFATVFLTIENQNGIIMVGMPSNNSLVNYLIGGGSAPSGSFGLNTIENAYSRLGSTSNVSWTSDVPNRKRKSSVARFGVSVGNGHVKEYDFSNLLRVPLPAEGIFAGQSYTGVNLGSGDGVKRSFILPSAYIKQNSLTIKKNNTLESGYSLKNIVLEHNNRISNPAFLPSSQSQGVTLTPDGLIMAVAQWTSPFVTTYDLVEGAWVKRPDPSSLPASNSRGVALTPDGAVMAVAHQNSPFIATYDWVEGAWVKRPNPASLPAGNGRGVALTSDGLIMAVAHDVSPFITTYDWVEGAWVKRPNPSSLPASTGYGVALTPDGLVMAVAHWTSPFITTYDWVGGAWVKRPNPASLPPGVGYGVALTPDGTVMAVAHDFSPYATTYDWVEGAWVKRPNPSSLPASTGYGVALTPDGLVMAVAHWTSPFITTYDWVGGAWVKRPNPASLPPGVGYGVALTHDGAVMVVAHDYSPCITTYDWVGGAWMKRPNPASLPTNVGMGVALTPDGLIMAVAHTQSPYVTTYKSLPFTQITFDTPPALGDVITADYTVDGVHKTDQYVIDISFEIQFGEGV